MGQAQINVRTRACSRTSIARTKQAALTHNVRGKELREMFPSRELIKENVPPCFKSLTNVRVILDCFEIFAEHPRHFSEQENMYSSYKHHSTKFKKRLYFLNNSF